MKWHLFFGLCFAIQLPCQAQQLNQDNLFRTLKSNDSLLFEVGFNGCDLRPLELLVSDNFEFYHGQSGVTRSKAAFISSIKNGLCKMDYRAKRVLVDSSLKVYPLKQQGVIYGAVQSGVHHFYAIEGNKTEKLTSTALFTHLWLLENGQWKLTRVLSYAHIVP